MTKTRAELIKDIDQEIITAQINQQVAEKQLAELRPKRQQMEDDCKKTFDVTMLELPNYIQTIEQELDEEIALLAADIEKAKAA